MSDGPTQIHFSDNVESLAELSYWLLIVYCILIGISCFFIICGMVCGGDPRRVVNIRYAKLQDIDNWVEKLSSSRI